MTYSRGLTEMIVTFLKLIEIIKHLLLLKMSRILYMFWVSMCSVWLNVSNSRINHKDSRKGIQEGRFSLVQRQFKNVFNVKWIYVIYKTKILQCILAFAKSAHALAPCVARPSSTTALNMHKTALVYHKQWFRLPAPFQRWKGLKLLITYRCASKIILYSERVKIRPVVVIKYDIAIAITYIIRVHQIITGNGARRQTVSCGI